MEKVKRVPGRAKRSAIVINIFDKENLKFEGNEIYGCDGTPDITLNDEDLVDLEEKITALLMTQGEGEEDDDEFFDMAEDILGASK